MHTIKFLLPDERTATLRRPTWKRATDAVVLWADAFFHTTHVSYDHAMAALSEANITVTID